MAQILLVDDDPLLLEGFEQLLQDEGYEVVTAASGTEALDRLPGLHPQCIVMDVRLPGMDGLSTLKAMRSSPSCPPVLIMTAYGTTDTAIEAMKLGAFDYILKPFEIPKVLALIARAVEAGERQKAHDSQGGETGEESVCLVGSSAPMQKLYKAIGRVAPTDVQVLLRGESGTGKELVARSLWKYSPRADRPFVVINCVAIPDSLLESELFGYERGSFTGADQARPGRIEQAAGGTVFLDEIGDMPLSVQAKFLRLLQERQIERIGAPNPVPVDVRIIAATNVDLEKAVQEGRFREDLYYRLKVVTLWLPPLRNRLDDIPELAQALLARHAAHIGVHNPGIEKDALGYLASQIWPGNVRELSNVLQKVLVFSDGSPIRRSDLLRVQDFDRHAIGGDAAPAEGSTNPNPGNSQSPAGETRLDSAGASGEPEASPDADRILEPLIDPLLREGGSAFDRCMDLMGRVVVKRALEMADGNRSRAARMLGLSRPTLLARMERYGLRVETRIR